MNHYWHSFEDQDGVTRYAYLADNDTFKGLSLEVPRSIRGKRYVRQLQGEASAEDIAAVEACYSHLTANIDYLNVSKTRRLASSLVYLYGHDKAPDFLWRAIGEARRLSRSLRTDTRIIDFCAWLRLEPTTILWASARPSMYAQDALVSLDVAPASLAGFAVYPFVRDTQRAVVSLAVSAPIGIQLCEDNTPEDRVRVH